MARGPLLTLALAATLAVAAGLRICQSTDWAQLDSSGSIDGIYTPSLSNSTLPGCSGEVYTNGMYAAAFDGVSWNWGSAALLTCNPSQGVLLQGTASPGQVIHPGNEVLNSTVTCVSAPSTAACSADSSIVVTGITSPLLMNGLYRPVSSSVCAGGWVYTNNMYSIVSDGVTWKWGMDMSCPSAYATYLMYGHAADGLPDYPGNVAVFSQPNVTGAPAARCVATQSYPAAVPPPSPLPPSAPSPVTILPPPSVPSPVTVSQPLPLPPSAPSPVTVSQPSHLLPPDAPVAALQSSAPSPLPPAVPPPSAPLPIPPSPLNAPLSAPSPLPVAVPPLSAVGVPPLVAPSMAATSPPLVLLAPGEVWFPPTPPLASSPLGQTATETPAIEITALSAATNTAVSGTAPAPQPASLPVLGPTASLPASSITATLAPSASLSPGESWIPTAPAPAPGPTTPAPAPLQPPPPQPPLQPLPSPHRSPSPFLLHPPYQWLPTLRQT